MSKSHSFPRILGLLAVIVVGYAFVAAGPAWSQPGGVSRRPSIRSRLPRRISSTLASSSVPPAISISL